MTARHESSGSRRSATDCPIRVGLVAIGKRRVANSGTDVGLEARLWQAADALRNNLAGCWTAARWFIESHDAKLRDISNCSQKSNDTTWRIAKMNLAMRGIDAQMPHGNPGPVAIKKSDLYASIWASCDELRGGMDASQYKDYVLFMLFIKYITDKYGSSSDFAPPVTIPNGASFKDMIALKGQSDIGDKINTQVIQPLIDANARLARSDFPDFNDPNKLGEGQAMVDCLMNLIGIFQKPELDFSQKKESKP
jgi:type I restriction-modification system DNA methylase subunit